ncbi:MAG: hypothetical protein ABF384_02360 [Verrucomicrobiales bacterium]|jgi:hypothetical protein
MAEHLADLAPCPFLPSVDRVHKAAEMRVLGKNRGEEFYLLALTCAQSLWLQGLPAQAVLLLNRAFSADLREDAEILRMWPLPYAAMHWVMSNRKDEHFVGNPRRHFQHLATRMVEPRKVMRSWRAWACWAYACEIFPEYPADEKQIAEEGVVEPGREKIAEELREHGLKGEDLLWERWL